MPHVSFQIDLMQRVVAARSSFQSLCFGHMGYVYFEVCVGMTLSLAIVTVSVILRLLCGKLVSLLATCDLRCVRHIICKPNGCEGLVSMGCHIFRSTGRIGNIVFDRFQLRDLFLWL